MARPRRPRCARSCSSRGGRIGCRSSAGLFLLVGLSSPLLARFLPEIIKAAGGDQFGDHPDPDPDRGRRRRPALEEPRPVRGVRRDHPGDGRGRRRRQERGTAAFVLSKPVAAGAFLAAKVVAIGAVLAVSRRSLAVAVGWVYTAILFEPLPIAGWIALAAAGLARPRAPGRRSRSSASRSPAPRRPRPGIGFVALLVLSIVSADPGARPVHAGRARRRRRSALATGDAGRRRRDLVDPGRRRRSR